MPKPFLPRINLLKQQLKLSLITSYCIMVYLRGLTTTYLKVKWLKNSVNWLVWRSQKPPVIILWGMACAKGSTEQYSTCLGRWNHIKTELEGLHRSNDPFIQLYKAWVKRTDTISIDVWTKPHVANICDTRTSCRGTTTQFKMHIWLMYTKCLS